MLDALGPLLPFVAQILIPIAILYAGHLVARAQYTKSIQDAWNEFNQLVLASPEHLRIVRELPGFAAVGSTDEETRKAYLAFVLLNTFQGAFLGARRWLLDRRYQRAIFRDLLTPLVADDGLFDLSQSRGYHPAFTAECRRLRKEARGG